MKTLTFLYDIELNHDGCFIKAGQICEIADMEIQYEGYTPIVVRECYNEKCQKIECYDVDYYSNDLFVEYLKEVV